MSMSPRRGSPPWTSRAMTIIPAHVPRTGIPAAARRRIGSTRSCPRASFEMVVDSPPGMASTSTVERSSAVRTSTGIAPHSANIAACSRKSPCRARTPAFIPRAMIAAAPKAAPGQPGRGPPLPAAGLEERLLRHAGHVEAAHGLAQASRDLRQDVGVLVVGGGLDDGPGPRGRVLGLEDPAAHEVAVGPELHHQGG